ncbi:MAG: helix-turn-helix domain-containing protein [Planctomycetota bacterium]
MVKRTENAARLWEVASSPVRAEILSLIESVGRATVGELADAMDRPADGLYHHIHKMEEVGLIRIAGERKAVRGTELVYEPIQDAFIDAFGPEHADRIERFAQQMASGVLRAARDATASGMITARGTQRNTVLRFETAKLTRGEAERVWQHLYEAWQVFEQARQRLGDTDRADDDGVDASLFSAALILTPVIRERRHRGAETPNGTTPAKGEST